jgi:hypothetical protein
MSSDDPSARMTPLETPGEDPTKTTWGEEEVTHVGNMEHETFLASGTPAFMLYYKLVTALTFVKILFFSSQSIGFSYSIR